MSTPIFTPDEARMHATYLALLGALTHPGRPYDLEVPGAGAFLAIADALIDLETTCFTPDPSLGRRLIGTGARATPLPLARYVFYPVLTPRDLEALPDAAVGSYEAPENSATLIVGSGIGGPEATRLRLSGPGVPGPAEVAVGGIPAAFWDLRAEANRYPLGWDVFLVAPDRRRARVVGLPRTARVEVL